VWTRIKEFFQDLKKIGAAEAQRQSGPVVMKAERKAIIIGLAFSNPKTFHM